MLGKSVGFASVLIVVIVVGLIVIAGLVFFSGKKEPKTPTDTKEIDTKETIQSTPVPKAINETTFPLILPDGFRITQFIQKSLGPIRFMAISPDGILFVSKPSTQGLYQGKGGGIIFALPDKDKDGKADEVVTVLSNLQNLPHGLVFHNNYLYVAEEGRVLRYQYLGNGQVGGEETVVTNLPSGADHVSRTIGFSPAGKMYVSVGSSCNACKESDQRRAAISEYNPDGSMSRVYAEGLRNAVGFIFHPQTGQMWATDNGRDNLGDDLPPDEINIIQDGKHYGWPYCYGKKVVDPEFGNNTFCPNTESSTYDMLAHSASLGLRFIQSPQFPKEWQGDLLVAYHGSWNRSKPTGYKVVRLNVEGDKIVGEEDFISGFLPEGARLDGPGSALGRPVDLIFDSDGALYISDDKAGVIYRVTKLESSASPFSLSSPAFEHNGSIPAKYTCDGGGISPPLQIKGVPENAKSLVLIMDDPDAVEIVGHAWDHWVLFNIDPNTKTIAEGGGPIGTLGVGSLGKTNYEGPCPPKPREHGYSFRLYSLDTTLGLAEGTKKSDVEKAMQGHILVKTELVGRYKR